MPICFDRCGSLCCCRSAKCSADQSRRQTIAFAEHFQLDQQRLLHVARAATDRIETHHCLTRTLDDLFRNLLHRANLFVGRIETTVGVQVSDDADRRIDQLAVRSSSCSVAIRDVRPVMAVCQKLFEGGSVFFVLDLLRFVAGIEVILKLTSEVDLFKRIALRFVRHAFFAAAFFVFAGGQRLDPVHLQ